MTQVQTNTLNVVRVVHTVHIEICNRLPSFLLHVICVITLILFVRPSYAVTPAPSLVPQPTPVGVAPFGFCVYNKTKQQTMRVGTAAALNGAAIAANPTLRHLPAGAHFCCKTGERMCPGISSVLSPAIDNVQVNVEAVINAKNIWCGNTALPKAGIRIDAHDGYLLIRDGRDGRDGRDITTSVSASNATTISKSMSANRVAFNVDALAADGRLLATWPCQYVG